MKNSTPTYVENNGVIKLAKYSPEEYKRMKHHQEMMKSYLLMKALKKLNPTKLQFDKHQFYEFWTMAERSNTETVYVEFKEYSLSFDVFVSDTLIETKKIELFPDGQIRTKCFKPLCTSTRIYAVGEVEKIKNVKEGLERTYQTIVKYIIEKKDKNFLKKLQES